MTCFPEILQKIDPLSVKVSALCHSISIYLLIIIFFYEEGSIARLTGTDRLAWSRVLLSS